MTAHAPRHRPGRAELHRALAEALERAHAQGLRVPCSGRAEDFTSDDADALAEAAAACCWCPVLDPCKAAGAHEDAGVWGGIVRDRDLRRPTPPPTEVRELAQLAILAALADLGDVRSVDLDAAAVALGVTRGAAKSARLALRAAGLLSFDPGASPLWRLTPAGLAAIG